MDKAEIINELDKNGIVVNEVESGIYSVIFDHKYSPVIERNLRTYGLEHFLISARNRATMSGLIPPFMEMPQGRILSSNPYTFEIVASFIVVVFFIERIVVEAE